MCVKIINKLVEIHLKNKYEYINIENSVRVFVTNMEELIKVDRILKIPVIIVSKEFFEISPSTQKFLITTMSYYMSNNQHETIFDADEYATYKLGYRFVLSAMQEIADKYLDEGKYRLRCKMLARIHNIKTKGGIING